MYFVVKVVCFVELPSGAHVVETNGAERTFSVCFTGLEFMTKTGLCVATDDTLTEGVGLGLYLTGSFLT